MARPLVKPIPSDEFEARFHSRSRMEAVTSLPLEGEEGVLYYFWTHRVFKDKYYLLVYTKDEGWLANAMVAVTRGYANRFCAAAGFAVMAGAVNPMLNGYKDNDKKKGGSPYADF